MFSNQRRMLSHDFIRRIQNPVASVARKPSGCRLSSHFSDAPITAKPRITTTRQYRVLQVIPSPSSRYFSSVAVEESTSQEVERPSTTGEQRTVAEQIDPNGTDLPINSWVQVNYIPPTSSLEDILNSVTKYLNEEYTSKGIIDLEGYWSPPAEPPMLQNLDTSKCVELAYLVLSPYGRPTGWRLKFTNRSIAHCFLEAAKAKPFKCAWKETEVFPWMGRDEELLSDLSALVSDAAIRVENCSDEVTEGQCRHLFRRYDLAWEGPSVVQIGGEVVGGREVPNSFIIRFADASWARAALRELQGVEFRGSVLRLAQFPKQII